MLGEGGGPKSREEEPSATSRLDREPGKTSLTVTHERCRPVHTLIYSAMARQGGLVLKWVIRFVREFGRARAASADLRRAYALYNHRFCAEAAEILKTFARRAIRPATTRSFPASSS